MTFVFLHKQKILARGNSQVSSSKLANTVADTSKRYCIHFVPLIIFLIMFHQVAAISTYGNSHAILPFQ
jgi:hypothetical protein